MGEVSVKAATLCDDPGAATGPVLGGPLWKGLLKWEAEGVIALKAGEGCIEGDGKVERTDEDARE